jgi:oligogalacturonide lyase
MAAGQVTPSERITWTDPVSSAAVTTLTAYKAHSHHPYFTNPGFWDGGRRLVFGSDRDNATNIFSVHLKSGEITQASDFAPGECQTALHTYVNPARPETYTFAHRDGQLSLWAMDLEACTTRHLCDIPEGYRNTNLSVTADGRTVCFGVTEDLSERFRIDMLNQYVGFVETFEAKPHSQIFRVSVDGGEPELLHEDQCWIGHVNASSADPDALTFCHEGPWNRLQRLWGLRLSNKEVRPLRPQQPGEAIGHEYWFADGKRVGYHGWLDTDTHLFGYVNWETAEKREWPWQGNSMHFHSVDETLIVGDGRKGKNPNLLLWKLDGDRYVGPRILMNHGGSYHVQILHPHPRMFRDESGRLRVLLTADPAGYGQVHIVDVPDFEDLPEAKNV